MTVTRVRAGGRRADYPVLVRRGLLADLPGLLEEHAPAHRYAVVSDDTVADLYGADLCERIADAGRPTDLLTFPAGERHKARETWSRLTDELLDLGHGRDSVVLAVGGGVTGDLAGFVAATFMRGVGVVQVPTSLVAMFDASIGGKTGVDAPAGKNLVGAFHAPLLVAADPDTIATLPRRERAQGLAEAVKHGAILDRAYLEGLEERAEELLDGREEAVAWAVARSVELKAEVVSRDEREGGLREILNFGHTLGHALEAASDFRLPHGSAVASGMVLEALLGERLGVTEPGTSESLARIVERFGLPATPADFVDLALGRDRVSTALELDKKGRLGRTRFVLLAEPGRVAEGDPGWSRAVDATLVDSLLEDVL